MSIQAGWGSWLAGWAGRLSWRGSCAGRLWSDRGGWRDREEWSSLRMKRQKWPARTNSSILSWSALQSSVVWP